MSISQQRTFNCTFDSLYLYKGFCLCTHSLTIQCLLLKESLLYSFTNWKINNPWLLSKPLSFINSESQIYHTLNLSKIRTYILVNLTDRTPLETRRVLAAWSSYLHQTTTTTTSHADRQSSYLPTSHRRINQGALKPILLAFLRYHGHEQILRSMIV